MLKKAEEEKAELTAENSSLRNAVVDSKARIAGYEQSLGALRAEKKKAEKKISELEHFNRELRAYGDEEHFLRKALEEYVVANTALTKELIRQLYANSRSEKASELEKKGICVSPAADRPSDSPDTLKAETAGGKRGRREGTADFECIPGKAETVDTVPKETPVCESCGIPMDERGAQEFYKLSYVPNYFEDPLHRPLLCLSALRKDIRHLGEGRRRLRAQRLHPEPRGLPFLSLLRSLSSEEPSARRPRPVGIPSLQDAHREILLHDGEGLRPHRSEDEGGPEEGPCGPHRRDPLQLPRSREPHQLLLGGHNRGVGAFEDHALPL